MIGDFLFAFRLMLRMRDIRSFYSGRKAWTNDDQKTLQTFLRSPFGKKLATHLDWVRCELITRSLIVKPGEDRSFKAGHAAGFNEFITQLHGLSAYVPPQADANTDSYPSADGNGFEPESAEFNRA